MTRVGIIGVAGVGAKHLQALQVLEGVRVTALVDRDPMAFASLGTSIARFSSMEECLDRVDAIYICTPPSSHERLAKIALKHGKHVMCEKPLAANLAAAKRMVKAAQETGCTLATGFNMRLRSSYQYLKQVVDSGVLGDPISYWCVRLGNLGVGSDNWRVTSTEAVGMTIESIAHEFDTIRWLFGDVTSVNARLRFTNGQLPAFDDNASIMMQTESKVIGTITASWTSAIGFGSRGIVGTKGSVEMRGTDIWSVSSVSWRTLADTVAHEEHFDEALGWTEYVGLARAFIAAVRGEPSDVPDAHDGVRALEVALAARRSARQDGRLVRP